MSVDAAERLRLWMCAVLTAGSKQVICEATVIGMIVFDLDAMAGAEGFELDLGVKSVFRGYGLRKDNAAEATVVIDENGDGLIVFVGEFAFELANEPSSG